MIRTSLFGNLRFAPVPVLEQHVLSALLACKALTPEKVVPGAVPFEQFADQYDGWFDTAQGRVVFQMETDTLRGLLEKMPRPWLEVGVGTGRFAHALGVDEGIDPSAAVLRLASKRGLTVRQGQAEHLPYPDHSIGAVLLVVTICFVEDPLLALQECRRVLRPDGGMIIGLVPKDSRWGRAYARLGAAGDPFYSTARFYTIQEITRLAEGAGFRLDRSRSTLLDAPTEKDIEYRPPHVGVHEDASFVALRFVCNGNERQGSDIAALRLER